MVNMRKQNEGRVIGNPPKFRAYLKVHENRFLLPEAIYKEAIRQRDLWNTLVSENESRRSAWLSAHPEYVAAVKNWKSLPDKRRLPHPKFGDKEYWKAWRDYLDGAANSGSGMERERNADIVNRFNSVFARMKHGGGAPKPHFGLSSFSILLVRYTGGGASLSALLGKSNRLRLSIPRPEAYVSNSRESRRDRFGAAWFGLGGEIFGLNVIFHAALPSEGIYKRVSLVGKKPSFAEPWEFHLCFTVQKEVAKPVRPAGRVAVDLNWRMIGDRVRYAVSYDGRRHREFYFPRAFFRKNVGVVSPETISEIVRVCSEMTNSAKEVAKVWLEKERGIAGDAFHKLGARGLRRILHDLERSESLDADSAYVMKGLRHWVTQYVHLIRKKRMLRDAWSGRREWVYRNVAKQLASSYGDILVSDLDISEAKDKEKNKEAKREGNYALWNARERRDYTALGTFAAALKRAATKRGGNVELFKAKPSTCAKCGKGIVALDAERSVEARCLSGHVADFDWNTASLIFSQTSHRNDRKTGLRRTKHSGDRQYAVNE